MSVDTIPANQPKLEAAFLKFHAEHPEVYRELVATARQLREHGWDSFGIATVFEICRYRSAIVRDIDELPRLNNNHRAFFARLIAHREPDLAGVFKTRKQGVPSHMVPA